MNKINKMRPTPEVMHSIIENGRIFSTWANRATEAKTATSRKVAAGFCWRAEGALTMSCLVYGASNVAAILKGAGVYVPVCVSCELI